MARLEKLQITGIRSFGPYEEHKQTLNFESPVTLILGENGSGKTTIIESIRYACTGDFPGGSKSGQGFVNDPKICGTASTTGQVKLKFKDSRDNTITVSKIVEVTQNKTNLSFKAKSATIRKVPPTGEETTVTNRCADVNAECCQYMNVPAAVLNNVIFCHQENASWPLEEAQKLKERFDEIFDAQKYNKCVDVLRKHLKEKGEKLKQLDVVVCYNREKKEFVDRRNRMLRSKEEKAEKFSDDIKTKKGELEPLINRMNEIYELERILGDLQKELTSKEATKQGIREEQNTIKKNLPFVFEGDDDQLHAKIESFEKDRRVDENLIAELETRKVDIENKSKIVSDAIQKAQNQMGELTQKKIQYEKKHTEVKKLFERSKNEMGMTDLHQFEDHAGAKAALYELKTELENKEMCLVSLVEETESEQKRLQEIIDKAREATVRTRQSITSKKEEISSSEKKIRDITNELITLSTSDDFMDDCVRKLEANEKSVSNLKKSFREDEESKKIEKYKTDIYGLERTLESLDGEYKILQQNDIAEGKIESEKHNIQAKQREINRIKNLHSNSLRQLFEEAIPERNLNEAVLSKQRNADVVIKAITDRINQKQKEVTTLDVQRQIQMDNINSSEKELRLNRNKVSQACSGRDFNETLNSTFQKKERLQIDKGQYNSVKIIYGQYIKKFEEESPCCPICETDFKQKAGLVQKIISSLKSKLEKVPQELTRVEAELQKEEALYSKLQQLKMLNEENEQMATVKLPQLKQRLAEIDESLNNGQRELKEMKAKLQEPQKIVEISKNIISDVSTLDQNQLDVEKSQRNIEDLKRGLMQVASNKSKQEIEAEMDQLKSEVEELRRKIDAQTKKINSHKDRLHQLLQERSSLVEAQMRLKENLQKKPLLEAQKVELAETTTKIKEELGRLVVQQQLQDDELKNVIENKDNIVRRNKQSVKEEREKVNAYSNTIQMIEKLEREIDEYLNEEVEAKLSTIENKLKEYRSKDTVLEETKTKIVDAIAQKRESLAKEELNFRTLKSNITLREKQAAEKRLETEITELKRRIGGFNYRTVYEEKLELEKQHTNLEKIINSLTGEKNGLMQTIEEERQELAKDENKKAYANYMSKLYEMKITELVIQDLKKYNIALEKAILEFHKSKMVQINRTIRELWRNTYRGNDLDYIEIKTEYASGNAARRSYNYKVVQIKKGVELDMRGRCSAGQKVLACLIIRMALAEIMSSSCGILALDEPTTNLDRANIYSLCDTLRRIITSRQNEKTFQLIIITHDEEFLNALTRVQGVSCYYRVKRNNDGFSMIRKEEVSL